MTTRLINELERIRYRAGQLLASRDLQDDRDFGALLRWMHTRFLHDTWGIASGLEVEELNDSKVRVWPGLAYDGYGREILLTQPVTIGVPAVAANDTGDTDRYLVIRYRDDAEFPRKPDVVAVCLPEETGPSLERPTFCPLGERPVLLWKWRDAVRLGEEVPLARYESSAQTLDPSVRRNARPLIRPHAGWGATKPGQTAWEEWKLDDEVIGFQVIIETSEAGFTRTPCYFAFLQGDLWTEQALSDLIMGPFESIVDESADGFTFRIMLPLGMTMDGRSVNDNFKNHFLAVAKKQKWHVFWIGVEPRIVTFAGRVLDLPPADGEGKRLGLWHVQVEGVASPWLVRVSLETVIDESEAQAKFSAWAEVQARPVIDGIWGAIRIKLHNSERP